MKDNTVVAKDYTDWMVETGGSAKNMTMRDYFAGLAMQGILMDEAITRDSDNSAKWIATIAAASYDMADAMLKERNK
jgi:hypothetical protein